MIAVKKQISEYDSLLELLEDLDRESVTAIQRREVYNRFLNLQARKKGIPMHGVFELTPLCNLDCKMCYVHVTPEQMGKQSLLTIDQWKALMSEAVAAGLMDATLTGGECLTYPGFDELYRYLHAQGVQIGVITNGLLLTEERIAFFRDYPVGGIQVSVYGSDDDTYERVTGHRVYSRVLANIKNAIDASLPVKVGITPSKQMGKDDERLLDMLCEMRIPFTLNSNLFAARPETGRSIDDYEQSAEDYIRLRKHYMKCKGIALPQPCEESGSVRFPAVGIQCGAGNTSFTCDWRGRMYACAMLPDITAYPLKVGFSQAWQDIRKQTQAYPNPVECNTCRFSSMCTKCVAAHRGGALPGHANPRICMLTKMISESET